LAQLNHSSEVVDAEAKEVKWPPKSLKNQQKSG
jgi:hypothetical protein